MPVKKSDLYRSLWKSCDELRGGMDASQYKDYVLVLLFVKYVSDKYAGQPGALLDVPAGGGFADMVALRGDKEIGDKMNKIVARLAEANELRGVIDVADWNDPDKLGRGAEMVERLSNLVAIFAKPELDFSGNRAEGDDLLGDAYEYLMRHFATESGKSKGQFYTPAEVSRVMAQVIGLGAATSSDQTIHDPACGSGSLLIKAHDEAYGRTGLKLALYGQEMDNATRALARMNMILHDCPTAEVEQGNTLAEPKWTAGDRALKRFDFVVANPPFSTKAWSNGIDPAHDVYGRFALGVPPQRNGDYAFLLHVLGCLKSTGRGAVILPHGVLFRGNAEGAIRRAVVQKGYIAGIIGLPPNLFYGTGIPACIVVLDKAGAAGRDGIFMVDASREFRKDGNKNRLRAQDIHRIVDTFARRADVPGYARLVPLAEVADPRNDYNLNLPRYVDAGAAEDRHDLEAHLRGGIPERDLDALGAYWDALPGVRETLFAPERPGYARLLRPAAEVRAAVLEHPSFAAFAAAVGARFDAWRAAYEPRLTSIAVGDRPKALAGGLSEGLLEAFRGLPLLDAYDVYQHLMDYWAESMQDDVYLVAQAGWREAARPRALARPGKGEKRTEQPDFKVGKLEFKADLVPPALLVARYFAGEQAAVEAREAELAAVEQELDALGEEHGGEGGLLEAVADDDGAITAAAVSARLGELVFGEDTEEEGLLLTRYGRLLQQQAEGKRGVRAARTALEARVAKQYDVLTEADVKALVVGDKWLARMEGDLRAEVGRAGQALAGRVRLLGERYAAPLPRLAEELDCLTARVDGHLQRMTAE